MLMLVDLQVGALSSIRTQSTARLKDNAIALATLAHMHRLPSVLTAGLKSGVGGVFLPELKAILAGHVYIARSCVAAFDEPAVAQAVRSTARTTIIMAGIATDVGLLYAALGAKDAGYSVIAVLDASGTTDRQADELARLRLASEGVILTGWASVAAGLMGDFAAPNSLETMALLAQRLETQGSPFG